MSRNNFVSTLGGTVCGALVGSVAVVAVLVWALSPTSPRKKPETKKSRPKTKFILIQGQGNA